MWELRGETIRKIGGKSMAFNASSSVQDIQALASKVNGAASNVEATLNQLRQSVTRADEFQGTAATNYDEFLTQWASHQANMIQSMRDAANLLNSYAQHLSDVDDGAFTRG